MRKYYFFVVSFLLMLNAPAVHAAADSYRWFHVTIETPIGIFLFLLPMVLFPAILMAFLYWRYAVSKAKVAKSKPVEIENTRN